MSLVGRPSQLSIQDFFFKKKLRLILIRNLSQYGVQFVVERRNVEDGMPGILVTDVSEKVSGGVTVPQGGGELMRETSSHIEYATPESKRPIPIHRGFLGPMENSVVQEASRTIDKGIAARVIITRAFDEEEIILGISVDDDGIIEITDNSFPPSAAVGKATIPRTNNRMRMRITDHITSAGASSNASDVDRSSTSSSAPPPSPLPSVTFVSDPPASQNVNIPTPTKRTVSSASMHLADQAPPNTVPTGTLTNSGVSAADLSPITTTSSATDLSLPVSPLAPGTLQTPSELSPTSGLVRTSRDISMTDSSMITSLLGAVTTYCNSTSTSTHDFRLAVVSAEVSVNISVSRSTSGSALSIASTPSTTTWMSRNQSNSSLTNEPFSPAAPGPLTTQLQQHGMNSASHTPQRPPRTLSWSSPPSTPAECYRAPPPRPRSFSTIPVMPSLPPASATPLVSVQSPAHRHVTPRLIPTPPTATRPTHQTYQGHRTPGRLTSAGTGSGSATPALPYMRSSSVRSPGANGGSQSVFGP